MKKPASNRRAIPSVEKVLQELGDAGLPRPLVVDVVRRELEVIRARQDIPPLEALMNRLHDRLEQWRKTRIQPVINGTGVVIHTNLGRAPLAPEVSETLLDVASGYNNLEYDLGQGERGRRGEYVERLLALICQAEAATVVNNCAAALVLVLRHFTAQRREVIISRGELVQIGGGFRIPEILEASGARLREVGTTNKTSLGDYEHAVGTETGLILKVHRSNFFMGGFVDSPSTPELAALAQARQVPFVEDLGSGAVVPTEALGPLEHEPTPAEVLRHGVDLVCFSGDKLWGGPQAGILAGKAHCIRELKHEPFFRALRCDKLILSALQTTAEIYMQAGGAVHSSRVGEKAGPSSPPPRIPVLSMLSTPLEALRRRAECLVQQLAEIPVRLEIGEGQGQVGGGTLPRSTFPSVTLDIVPAGRLEDLAARFRSGTPPVVGYIANGRFKLDLRTIFPHQDEALAAAVRAVFPSTPSIEAQPSHS